MSDDFKLVHYKRNRKIFKKQSPTNIQIIKSCISKEQILGYIDNICKTLRASSFFSSLLTNIKVSLQGTKLSKILCLGLGQFSFNISGRHQLAALLILKEHFECTVEVYDPLFNTTEVDVLQSQGLIVLPSNNEGKYILEENLTTLLYFPHCPKQLTNNFLWANWSSVLKHCVILGNSFTAIVENTCTLDESADYIQAIFPFTTELSLENTYINQTIFNSLAIHYFLQDNLANCQFNQYTCEPVYGTDLDFITKDTIIEVEQ